MGVNITVELYVFLATIISGILSGMIYDLFSVFRNGSRKKLFFTISDVILSFIICSVIVAVFYVYNSFNLRWYMFIGLFLGIIFYFLCISNIFVFVLEKILRLFHFIFKILLTPARFLYKILIVCLFIPIRAFIVILVRKFSEEMNKLKINRGIRKNGSRKKKSTKKKKSKTHNTDTYSGGAISDNKGYNASTADNRKLW